MCKLEQIQRGEGILNSQILRLVRLCIEILDSPFFYLLFLESLHYLLMGIHLEFLSHFLELNFLLAFPLQLLGGLLLLQGSNDENFSIFLDIFGKGFLILYEWRSTFNRGFIKLIFPSSMLNIL
jgi:hypothetical protein